MPLGNRLLPPNLCPSLSLAALLKARSRIGGVCLASPALLCSWLLMSAAATASPLQRLDDLPVKQSAATDMPAAEKPAAPTVSGSVLDSLPWRTAEQSLLEGSEDDSEALSSDEGAVAESPTEELPADISPADDVRPPETAVANRGWSVFASEAGKFRVSMPNAPAAYTFLPNVDLMDEQIFGSRMYMQMQLVDATHLEIYTAAFIASTRFTETSRDATEALLGCVTGLSDSDPVMPPQAIALGDYPGIEAEFLTAEGSLQVSRCYLAGDRAYLLTATNELFSAGAGLQPVTWGSSVPVRSPEMNTFFSSFEILP